MSIEAMKLALEYLQENEGCIADVSSSQYVKEYYEFMDHFAGVIKQAEQQEPVAWMHNVIEGNVITHIPADIGRHPERWTPLYTAPPKREWVGITDEEVSEVIDNVLEGGGWLDVARALEAAIKRKNA